MALPLENDINYGVVGRDVCIQQRQNYNISLQRSLQRFLPDNESPVPGCCRHALLFSKLQKRYCILRPVPLPYNHIRIFTLTPF